MAVFVYVIYAMTSLNGCPVKVYATYLYTTKPLTKPSALLTTSLGIVLDEILLRGMIV